MALKDFDEQFESTGYDETSAGVGSNWTEEYGSPDSDEPTSGVTGAPNDWDDYCLHLPTGTNRIYNSMDSGYADLYLRVEVIFSSISNTSYQEVFQATWSGIGQIVCYVKEASGSYYLASKLDESNNSPDQEISLNTRYRLEYHWDSGATSYWRIDDADVYNDTAVGRSGIDRLYIGAIGTNYVVYVDNVAYGDTDWIGSESGGGGGGSIVPIVTNLQRRRRG